MLRDRVGFVGDRFGSRSGRVFSAGDPPIFSQANRAVSAMGHHVTTVYIIAVMTSLNCGVDLLCQRAVEPDSTGVCVAPATVSWLKTMPSES